MTKRYDEPIDVTCDSAPFDAPLAFVWRGRRYDVDQHLKTWREAGEWWLRAGARRNGNGPPAGGARERDYHRVLAHPAGALATGDLDADGFIRSNGAVYDMYLDRNVGGWRLARVWD